MPHSLILYEPTVRIIDPGTNHALLVAWAAASVAELTASAGTVPGSSEKFPSQCQ